MAGLDIGTLRGAIVVDDLGSSRLTAFAQKTTQTEQTFNKSIGTGVPASADKARDATGKFVKSTETGLATVTKSSTTAGNGLATLAARSKSVSSSLTSNGTALSLGITAPITLLGGAAILSGAQFEKSMNTIKAVIQPTDAEMKKLQATAMKWGAETVFSAAQAADAMGELGKAGFTAQQSMDALPSVLQLAAATGMGLADAATLTANTMKTFGLETKDLTRVNDIFAKGANAATLDVTDLRESIKYVGPVAKTVGYDLGQTVSVMGLLSEAGIKGSMAGTALRGILTELLNPGKKLTDVMKQLGIESFQTNGKVDNLADVIDVMNARGITSAQVFEAFGDRAGPSLVELLDKGGAGLRTFNGLLDNSAGTAKRASEAMMEGLPGVLEEISGSTETASIALSTLLKPAVTAAGGAIGWLAGLVIDTLVPGVQGLPTPIKMTAVVLGSVAIAAGPVMIALGGVAKLFGLAAEGAMFFASTRAGVAMSNTLFAIGNSVPVLTARLWLMDVSQKAVTLSTTAVTAAQGFWLKSLIAVRESATVVTARIWLMQASEKASAVASGVAAGAKTVLGGAIAFVTTNATALAARLGLTTISIGAAGTASTIASIGVGALGTALLAVQYVLLPLAVGFATFKAAAAALDWAGWTDKAENFYGRLMGLSDAEIESGRAARISAEAHRNGLTPSLDEAAIAAKTAEEEFKGLKDRLSGDALAKDVEKLDRALGDFSKTGKVASEVKKRLAMDAINLRQQGAQLTPELAAIVGWFEKLSPAARKLGDGLNDAGTKTDKFTDALKSLREAQQGLVIDAKAMTQHLLGKQGISGLNNLTLSQQEALYSSLQSVVDEYGSLGKAGLGALQPIYQQLDGVVGRTADLKKEIAALISTNPLAVLEGLPGSIPIIQDTFYQAPAPVMDLRTSAVSQLPIANNPTDVLGGIHQMFAGVSLSVPAKASFLAPFREAFTGFAGDIPNIIAGAFQNGNGKAAIAGALATGLVATMAASFNSKINELMKFGADHANKFLRENPGLAAMGGVAVAGSSFIGGYSMGASGGKTKGVLGGAASGALAGAAYGSVVPGIGTAVGAVVGGAIGAIGGYLGGKSKDKKDLQAIKDGLIESAGGLANLKKLAAEAGVSIDALMSTNKKNVAEAEITKITQALEKQRKENELLARALANTGLSWKDLGEESRKAHLIELGADLIAQRDILITKGYQEQDVLTGLTGATNDYLNAALTTNTAIPASMAPMIQSMIEAGNITEENARLLLGMKESALPSFADITAAAERYGISVDNLGPKIATIRITEEATQMAADYNMLVGAGANVGAMLVGMKGKAQEFVTHALKFGSELPESMKPLLQKMVEHGLLTDASGKKLKDLSGINFAKPLTDMVSDLVGAMQKLVDAISGKDGVGGALTDINGREFRIKGRVDWENVQTGSGGSLSTKHTGGLISASDLPKAHSGKVLQGPWVTGLSSGEVPIIGKIGEAVLNPQLTATLGVDTIQRWNRNPESVAQDFDRGAAAAVRGTATPTPVGGGAGDVARVISAVQGSNASMLRELKRQPRATAREVAAAIARRSA